MTSKIKGMDKEVIRKIHFSWKPNTFLTYETGEERKMPGFMPKMEPDEWYAGIVASVLTKECGDNKVFIVSPEMSMPIQCTVQFMPVVHQAPIVEQVPEVAASEEAAADGKKKTGRKKKQHHEHVEVKKDSTQHERIGVLSPNKQEVWVNAFWPTNIISSFDSMETLGNRIDFVCKPNK